MKPSKKEPPRGWVRQCEVQEVQRKEVAVAKGLLVARVGPSEQ